MSKNNYLAYVYVYSVCNSSAILTAYSIYASWSASRPDAFSVTCLLNYTLATICQTLHRNSGKKRLTGAVFLDVAKAFDTVWIDGLLYKITFLNFLSYIVHAISSYRTDRTFEAPFQKAKLSRRGMWAEVAQGGLSPLSSSVCMSTTCPHLRTTLS